MEKSLTFEEECRSILGIEKVDIRTYSPLALAFIGDGFYELTIRTLLIHGGNAPTHQLQKRSSALAKAVSQARMAVLLEDRFTEEETRIYRRGKNAKTTSVAPHASPKEYRMATGLEALFGYLYLTDRSSRALELIRAGIELLEEDSHERA